MPLYEHVFLARQDISTQQVEGLIETFGSVLKENGGAVAKTEYWGLKNLTYKIKKNRKAHFALMNIDAPPAAVAEMERQMGISTDVIRFLTVRVEEHETGPSPMMKRGDRDDRRGGRREGGFRDRDGGGFRDRDGGGFRDRDRDRDRDKERDGPRGRDETGERPARAHSTDSEKA